MKIRCQNITMIKTITLGLLTGTLFLTGCCTTPRSATWEYKVIYGYISRVPGQPGELDRKINEAAAEGWQVVATAYDDRSPYVILRRNK